MPKINHSHTISKKIPKKYSFTPKNGNSGNFALKMVAGGWVQVNPGNDWILRAYVTATPPSGWSIE